MTDQVLNFCIIKDAKKVKKYIKIRIGDMLLFEKHTFIKDLEELKNQDLLQYNLTVTHYVY